MSVHAPVTDFAADDAFLDAVLGLIALAAHGRTAVAGAPPVLAAAVADDDPILLGLLGLARLVDQVDGLADAWAAPIAPPPVPAPTAAPVEPRIEELLR